MSGGDADWAFVPPPGAILVLFMSRRPGGSNASGDASEDGDGYAEAAAAMSALAARQPGYLGETSLRGPDGIGMTASWWRDEASVAAWRDHPEHVAIRKRARGRGGDPWYEGYALTVAEVRRAYGWGDAG